MKESISYTFLLNIIIVFIAISFFAIMGIISYSKAFRVNSKIINAIEINEGFNGYSKAAIDNALTSYGYTKLSRTCPMKEGQVAIEAASGKDGYCVYYFDQGDSYYYGVITYMNFDIPLIGRFIQIPVYTRTMQIKRLG